MITRVLVPLDGSNLAEAVLPYARQIRQAFNAKVALLRVVQPPSTSWPEDPAKYEQRRSLAEQYIDVVAKYFGEAAVASKAVIHGVPATEILRYANLGENSLTAMCSHGRSGLDRWLIGSVADKVLREVRGPLLLVPPAPRSPIQADPKLSRVLVALDGSAIAEAVIPDVEAMAKAMDLEVVLVRVSLAVPEYVRLGGVDDSGLIDAAREDATAAKAYLDGIRERVKKDGVARVTSAHLEGDPAAVLIGHSQADGTFVAMTTRGRTGLARTVLGSVADRVVRHGSAPVYLVRPA